MKLDLGILVLNLIVIMIGIKNNSNNNKTYNNDGNVIYFQQNF